MISRVICVSNFFDFTFACNVCEKRTNIFPIMSWSAPKFKPFVVHWYIDTTFAIFRNDIDNGRGPT